MVFFKGVIKKAIMQDLNDIETAVEQAGGNWEPIDRESLQRLITQDLADATAEARDLFARVAIKPTKWQLSPWGDPGGGFWAVAVMDDRVLWYNDIEEGFNVSRFTNTGTIPPSEYWCNQSKLGWAIPALAGQPQGRLGPPESL